MQILFTIVHIVACFVLILVVLLQAGKGASMGAAFGGSSQTVFGSSGPGTFLGKMTTIIATVFMLTSLALSYTALHRGSSLTEKRYRRHSSKQCRRRQKKLRLPLNSRRRLCSRNNFLNVSPDPRQIHSGAGSDRESSSL